MIFAEKLQRNLFYIIYRNYKLSLILFLREIKKNACFFSAIDVKSK